MAEGLEFLLELDAKLEGALSMVRALEKGDEALHKVDAGMRKVEAAAGHASAGHAKLGHQAEHTGGILRNLHHATLGPLIERFERIAEFEFIRRGVDALIEAPMEALHLFTELFEEMVKVAAEAERTQLSFELLFGQAEGRETLEWIESIGKNTEFTNNQLKGMAQSLAKVGFEGEGLTRALAASIDIAAFSSTGQAGADAALNSLERIKRTGRIDNRSLGGLGIGEKAFLEELSKRTGEGTKVLKKKIDEGKLDAEQSLEALYSMIAKKTGKDLGGAGVAMGQTLGAKLTHLKELPELFFEKLRSSKGFAAISEFVGKLVESLDPESAAGRKISTGLTSIFDKIGETLKDIDIGSTINTLINALTNLPSTMRPVIVAFQAIYDILKGIIFVLENIPGIHEFIELAKSTAATDKNYRGALGAFDKKTKSNWGAPEADSPEWLKKGKGMGEKLEEGTRAALGTHSPSTVFEDIGKNVGEGFNQGLGKSMSAGDDVARGAFAIPVPKSGAGIGGNTIHVEVNTTVHATGNGESIAKDVSDQIRELLPGALQSAIEQLGNQAGSA